jgi:hypothetical protein
MNSSIMGAINLLHDSLDALWDCVGIRLVGPADRLLLKQRVQLLLFAYENTSENPFEQFGTDELDSNRVRLAAAVRASYSDSDNDSDSESDSNQVTSTLALIFDTPDTPEYTALTDVLVRYIAVRDELEPDSSDSDSS